MAIPVFINTIKLIDNNHSSYYNYIKKITGYLLAIKNKEDIKVVA